MDLLNKTDMDQAGSGPTLMTLFRCKRTSSDNEFFDQPVYKGTIGAL